MKVAQSRGRRKIIANSGWLFIDKILRQGINFFLSAYIAQYLGVAEFGEWNYALAFVALFSFFSTLGLYNLLQRDFVRLPELKGELIGSAIALKFLGGCLTFIFSSIVIILLKPGATFTHVLVFVVAAGYVAQSLDVIDYYFQTQLQAQKIAMARSVSFCIIGALKISFIYLKLPLLYFAIAQSVEFLLSGMFLAFLIRLEIGLSTITIKWRMAKTLLISSVPILFSEIAIIIYMRTDQVMIGEMVGNEALGNYSAAVRLSEIWYFIPIIVSSSVFPSIIKAYAEDPMLYKKRLQQVYDLLSFISIGIGIFVSLFSGFIIAHTFGPSYSQAGPILTLHIWTGLFVFWGVASGNQLVIEDLTRISLYRTVSGMIINLGLNFLLIPRFGAIGSAFATLAAQSCAAYFFDFFHPATRPIFYLKSKSLLFTSLIHYAKK